MSKEAKRAGKLEDKAGKLTKGLVNIAEGLYREQDELMKEVQELEQQVFCFKHLEVQVRLPSLAGGIDAHGEASWLSQQPFQLGM